MTLTDESRTPLSEERDERSVTVDLASGKKRKFIKGIRRRWSVDWDSVPLDATYTIDGGGARNEIRTIAQSGDALTLTIQDGRNADEIYTIFITDYQETLEMRRPGDLTRYKITLGFEEVG